MTVNVQRALLIRGFANNGTPLLTASMPVIAVQPLANPRRSNHALIACVAVGLSAAVRPARDGPHLTTRAQVR